LSLPAATSEAACRYDQTDTLLGRRSILLSKAEIQRSLKRVQAAFPRFDHWKHNNENNESHMGFALWGEFVPEPTELTPRRFFITFDSYQIVWRGHLTIGQHCYFWSSADVGDAHLVDTGDCATLEHAITALKRQMVELFTALSGSAAEPDAASDRSGLR
jgi:hypothetical protein